MASGAGGRRTASVRLAAALAVVLAGSLLPARTEAPPFSPAAPEAAPVSITSGRNIDMYRGLGAWVDIYDPAAWRRPARTVRRLHERGVRTLYLETNNYHQPRKIRFPKATGKFVDAAHARGMKIVAWYLPGLKNMKRDRRRALAALRFRSPGGKRFHSFALDIEASIVKNVTKRNRRLLRLSDFLRRKARPKYPLGAIIPSPRGMELSPSYWPRFPYKRLAARYDVFVTMTYYSYRTSGAAGVTAYMRRSMDILRNKTGNREVPVHAIGGLADASNRAEGRAFVRAVREYGLIGASMYDDAIMGPEDWDEIVRVQPNPTQSPAMPLSFSTHTGEYGNIPGSDQSHPDEVVYRRGGLSGDRLLAFEGYDVGADEVEIYVNWKLVATLPAGEPDLWEPYVVPIPDSILNESGMNVFAFAPTVRHPWTTWGVRGATLTAAP